MGAHTSRARKIAAVTAAALLLAWVPVFAGSNRPAFAEDELKENKQELRETKSRIRARNQRLKMNQRTMNQLATRIARTESRLVEAEFRIERLGKQMVSLSLQLIMLETQLDERNREAYMTAGNEVLYLLTATSAAEAASRLSFLDELNRRDEELADKVAATRARRAELQAAIGRAHMEIDIGLQLIEADRAMLREKMAETRKLVAGLQVQVEEIQAEISRLRPFAFCPVDGTIAIADNFGIWVHRAKNQGGNHIHQGNDIMAAMGVPIVAPFDGTAVTATNHIGGKAVKVYGEFGYVYNAHLSAFGKLGAVEAGDVIGYVGATGNAGGPHDHFEWHPNDGKAVDPYDFLMIVC
jgi:murein DD-endopeptidase MepM/ murein hydrolase activator NlpD